jgi:nitrogen fixation protein NifQ
MYALNIDTHLNAEQAQHSFYSVLMRHSAALPNSEALARIIDSWLGGNSVLPWELGLASGQFAHLWQRHFPGLPLPALASYPTTKDPTRTQEQQELRSLLLEYRADDEIEREWIADILVAGSMGCDHLWQDLGLWARSDLSALIERNFPDLFARNVHAMKWKKFFYKQLCAREGIYVCRAPSCELCVDYHACFGAEE